MKFFLTFFLTCLGGRLKSWRTWALLVLLPLLTFGVLRLLPAEETSAPVQVGVVLPEEGGEVFWQKLSARSGLVVTFHRADAGQAERQVAAGQWDCALILPEDFSARLTRLDTDGLFTLLIGPGSAVYPLVRETVSACVAECISPDIAERYLLDSGIVDNEGIASVRPRLEEVLLDRDRVLVAMETADGAPLNPLVLADSGVARIISGLTAILLLIWAMLTAMDLGRWLDSPAARRLTPLRGCFSLLLPRLASALMPAMCAGALALLALDSPLDDILSLIPYLLFLGAVAMALARCRPLWGALPALMPFVPVLCLLLSPVLMDISLIFPELAAVSRWLPVTLYLRACDGLWEDALTLAVGGMALLGLLAVLDRRKVRGT